MLLDKSLKIAVIGLGYVGLPLAVEFAKKFRVIGFDINQSRIQSLNEGVDLTKEVSTDYLKAVLIKEADIHSATGLLLSCAPHQLHDINVFIITVPTPVDAYNQPNFTPLIKASTTVGQYLTKDAVVIYESTVYPGATEEVCIPVLEKASGLKHNIDFFTGYSPERINPGDKQHTLVNIRKITSGSTPEIADFVDDIYSSIIQSGTYKASSIKVAEAAKVIENAQRDINIAFVNELAMIFNKLGIDTKEVLQAAGTKWNFLPFQPGLVGGHCIGVDPYYLAQKAVSVGYHPEIILAGRRINDRMGEYIASELILGMIKRQLDVRNAKVLVLGITFKENCPDIRNTKVVDVINSLQAYGLEVDVYDPLADPEELRHEYGIVMAKAEVISQSKYASIILAVAHEELVNAPLNHLLSKDGFIYDVKGVLTRTANVQRL